MTSRGLIETPDRDQTESRSRRHLSAVKYAFGSVRVDADARAISTAAGTVHLTRKAFDLLLLLLECRPDAVTKEQIYARVWPHTFVADSSLQTVIHEIRQAIDVPGSRESWIRTVHGVGYRFCGDVQVTGPPLRAARPGPPAAWLVGDSMRVVLQAGENVVGRGTEPDLIQIQEPTISRRHARIVIGDSMTLEDLGSKNGTWLEGARVTTPRVLSDGNLVKLCSASFTFRVARQPTPTVSAVGQPDDT
jgi:DNA-binding winged helix-turn-helix (wHTH) protein